MIRFACPGCGATFTVDEAKAGKVGKCPKCQSQFQIPKPDPNAGGTLPPPAAYAPPPNLAPVAPPPPPPPPPVIAPAASASTSVEIAPCPKCSARLTVGISDLGADVECPYCKTIYRASRGDALVPVAPPPSQAPVDDFAALGDSDDEPPPSKRRGSKASKRSQRDDDGDDDRPSRRSNRDDDDDDKDRPARRSRRSRRGGGSNQESKRITAGILALLVGGFGVHKFYLGYSTAGVIMLLLACTGVTGFIALAEGIIYLTKTDEEFIEMYQDNTKEWF